MSLTSLKLREAEVSLDQLKEYTGIEETDLEPLLSDIQWGLTLDHQKVMCFIGPPQSGKTSLISALSLLAVGTGKENEIKITTKQSLIDDCFKKSNKSHSETSTTANNNSQQQKRGRIYGAPPDTVEKSVTFAGRELALMDTRGLVESDDNDESYQQVKHDIEVCRPSALFTVLCSNDVKEYPQNKKRAIDTLEKAKKIHTDYVNTLSSENKDPTTVTIPHEIVITHMDEYDPDFFIHDFQPMITMFQVEYRVSTVYQKKQKELELKGEKENQTKLEQECEMLRSVTSPTSQGMFGTLFYSEASLQELRMKEEELNRKSTQLTIVKRKAEMLEAELRILNAKNQSTATELIEKSYAYAITKYVDYLSNQEPQQTNHLSVKNDLIRKIKEITNGTSTTTAAANSGEVAVEIKFGDLISQVFKDHFQSNSYFTSMLKERGYGEGTKIHFIFNNTAVNVNCSSSSVYNEFNWGIEQLLNSIKESTLTATIPRTENVIQKMKVNLAIIITRQFFKLIQTNWSVIKDVGPPNVESDNDIPFIINLLVKTLSIIKTSKSKKITYHKAIKEVKDKFDEIVVKRRNMVACDYFYFFGGFIPINVHYHPRLCDDLVIVARRTIEFYMDCDKTESGRISRRENMADFSILVKKRKRDEY